MPSPGELSDPDGNGVPIDIRNQNGVCNYLTTHTTQASGGIEQLVLWGMNQGLSIAQTQSNIQQAVNDVCPWNRESFAKHVMTDTSNF